MKSMLETSLTDLKCAHAETAESHLNEIKKLKFDEPHRFKKKGSEDQYRFNLKVGDAIEDAKGACSSQQFDKVEPKPGHWRARCPLNSSKFQPAQ